MNMIMITYGIASAKFLPSFRKPGYAPTPLMNLIDITER